MKYKVSLVISLIILSMVIINVIPEKKEEMPVDRLIAYVDGRKTGTIPVKTDGLSVQRIECDNNAEATWDNETWGILIKDISASGTTCSVYFTSAPTPELYEGLIPVVYDENGDTIVADTNDNWYSYYNHKWANAVLGTTSARLKSPGQKLNESEILQYYVWIPRYRYKLFNAVAGESTPEQMIEVEFESKYKAKSNGTTNGQWLTHPAFTFGNTELNGIWVGKFETSHSDSEYIDQATANKLGCSNENCTSASGLIIKPNVISIVHNNIANMFYASRSIENSSSFGLNSSEVDTHMMKNMEWGAVAYLSASKYGLYIDEDTCYNSDNNATISINNSDVNRCEVWKNDTQTGISSASTYIAKYGGTITGCSAVTHRYNDIRNLMTTCGGTQYEWNGEVNNGRSSTTGNIYGIYDMVGGAWDYVMANQSSSASTFVFEPSSSNFTTAPDEKYYDKYLASEYTDASSQRVDQKRGLLGDAMRETIKEYGNVGGGWFNDTAMFMVNNASFVERGGYVTDTIGTGLFRYYAGSGGASPHETFRITMTAEDN